MIALRSVNEGLPFPITSHSTERSFRCVMNVVRVGIGASAIVQILRVSKVLQFDVRTDEVLENREMGQGDAFPVDENAS